MKRSITIFLFLLLQASLTDSGNLFSQCTNCRETQSNHHHASSAIGIKAKAIGQAAFASGFEAVASGHRSTGIGNMIHASGEKAMVFGNNASSLGNSSMVIGSGYGETASEHLINAMENSLMVGFNSIYPTLFISKSPSKHTTGRVGIGNVTEPLAKLHIRAGHGEQAGLFVEQDNFRLLNMFLGDMKHGLSAVDDIGLVFLSANNYIFRNGAVGIGTNNPSYLLDVRGSTNTKRLRIYDQELYRENIEGWVLSSDEQGNAYWTNPADFNDNDWLESGNNIYRASGDVGIGTSETFGYRLAVNGAIITEEVTVKVREAWPDYVFHENYDLMSIDELRNYISEQGHLPGIPAADAVLEAGVEVGRMQSLLLQKIEELTLYIFQQQSKIMDLEGQVNHLLAGQVSDK
jgi:hypothetical protein